MFEMPPFWDCSSCSARGAFGVLNVYDNHYTRRCTKCRRTMDLPLSRPNKRVIYIDQFAISNLAKIQHNSAAYTGPHKTFWVELSRRLDRLLVKQQAIFPDSNIHQDESLLSRLYEQFRDMYEGINGDVSLLSYQDVTRNQILHAAQSWLASQSAPTFDLNVDGILEGQRNAWLPPYKVTVRSDFSKFSDSIRAARDDLAKEMVSIFEDWGSARKPFQEVVQDELRGFGRGFMNALVDNAMRIQHALEVNDAEALGDLIHHDTQRIRRQLIRQFRRHGIAEHEHHDHLTHFFQWDGLHSLPCNRIAAYLYAAIARKAGAGQKRPPSPGMTNDVRVISRYAPYLDAMFIDNECAAFLAEEPLCSDLEYKAQIFSLNSRDAFLAYLQKIEIDADPDVIKDAQEVYGVGM